MTAVRMMPLPAAFKAMVEAQPEMPVKQWAQRFECSDMAVRATAAAAGVKIRRAPHWRKGHVGMRLTADHVSVAHTIVSNASGYLTDYDR